MLCDARRAVVEFIGCETLTIDKIRDRAVVPGFRLIVAKPFGIVRNKDLRRVRVDVVSFHVFSVAQI